VTPCQTRDIAMAYILYVELVAQLRKMLVNKYPPVMAALEWKCSGHGESKLAWSMAGGLFDPCLVFCQLPTP
jgi:hypothetical protein